MAVNLHDLVCVLAAPTCALSARDGDIRDGIGGAVHADVRVLSRCELLVDGVRPTLLTHHEGSTEASFVSVMTTAGYADAELRLDRRRSVSPGRVEEEIWLTTASPEPRDTEVSYLLASDFAPVTAMRERSPTGHGFDPEISGTHARWGDRRTECVLSATAATIEPVSPHTLRLAWTATVSRGQGCRIGWTLEVTDTGSAVVAPTTPGLDVPATVERLLGSVHPERRRSARAWLTRSLEDLNALRLALPGAPEDAFFAAGAPWFLTLFGRDALWTARMLVGIDLDHAGATLRTLAGLQAAATDPLSLGAPGKIPHELRHDVLDLGERSIPPLYYGSVDATALWVCLLHDAWQAGLADEQVRTLLPSLRAALAWITGDADPDHDGFAEYADTGDGLVNQCWKDSPDSIRFADGRLATGSIAVCEAQAYAHEAAVGGAEILDAFGSDGRPYREWARGLRTRFRERFWCGDGAERHPALALDGLKNPVDATTSNIGHLLGTGLLDADEERWVVARLLRSDMFSGLGLRTMSSADTGYWPLSYHRGSVWPHDTAIALFGMLRSGFDAEAATLARGLLRAAEQCDFRLPELFGGDSEMIPYPTACRPQAWSAAAAVVAARNHL